MTLPTFPPPPINRWQRAVAGLLLIGLVVPWWIGLVVLIRWTF